MRAGPTWRDELGVWLIGSMELLLEHDGTYVTIDIDKVIRTNDGWRLAEEVEVKD